MDFSTDIHAICNTNDAAFLTIPLTVLRQAMKIFGMHGCMKLATNSEIGEKAKPIYPSLPSIDQTSCIPSRDSGFYSFCAFHEYFEQVIFY